MYLFKHLLGFVSVGLAFSFPFGNVAHRASCQPWLTTFASDFKLVANVIGDNSANAHLSISASTGNEGIGSAWIIDQTNNIRFTLVNGALNGTIVNPNEFDDEVGGVSGLSQNDPTIPNFIPSSGLSTEDEISGLIWLAVSDSNCNWTLVPVVNEAIVGLWYTTSWSAGTSVFWCSDLAVCASVYAGSEFSYCMSSPLRYLDPVNLKIKYH